MVAEATESSSVASTSATAAVIEGFGGIKRIRLDSSDKEKNVQLEMERRLTNENMEEEGESSEDVSKNEDIAEGGAAPEAVYGACGGVPAAGAQFNTVLKSILKSISKNVLKSILKVL